jgi:hypothetical protein
VYDADGNRVEKTGGGTTTLYWYMTLLWPIAALRAVLSTRSRAISLRSRAITAILVRDVG